MEKANLPIIGKPVGHSGGRARLPASSVELVESDSFPDTALSRDAVETVVPASAWGGLLLAQANSIEDMTGIDTPPVSPSSATTGGATASSAGAAGGGAAASSGLGWGWYLGGGLAVGAAASGGGGGGGGNGGASGDTASSDLPASNATDAQLTVGGGAANGVIANATDQDWYRVTLTAGTTYTMTQARALGSSLDGMLRLYDANGAVVASNDDDLGSYDPRIVFAASTTGTYFLAAGAAAQTVASQTLSGDYSVAVVTGSSGDFPASTGTHGSLTANALASSGSIGWAGDRDWYRISLTGGTAYSMAMNAAAGSTLDSVLRLYTANGVELASDDDGGGGRNALITYTSTVGGTYFVSAQGLATSQGDYTLRVSTGTAASRPSVTISDDQPGTAGGAVTFTMHFSEPVTGFTSSDITVSGGTLGTLSGSGSDYTLVVTPPSNSTSDITLSISAGVASASSGQTNTAAGPYTQSVNTVSSSTDFPASTSTTANLTIGGSGGGTIGVAGDEDWFRMSLTSGTAYTFAQTRLGASLLDSYLRLYDASGQLVTFNDDYGPSLDSQIGFTPTVSGTYYLSAGGLNSSTGDYTVVAVSGTTTGDAFPPSTSTSGSIAAGGSAVTGAINFSGDEDWLRISLTAGTTYSLSQNSTGTSQLDSYLRLYDANGSLMAFNDDGSTGLNSLMTFTPTTSGTYYLAAGGLGSSTGNYSVLATAGVSSTYTPGQTSIDLGQYGQLIAPQNVDGNWYYYWDRSGDGTSANTGSLNGGSDTVTHDVLDSLFTRDASGTVGGAGNTTDTYRYATLNGVSVALPRIGGAAGASGAQPGTAVDNNPVGELNFTYNDLLSVWDAYNGTGTSTGDDARPSGWAGNFTSYYWSATPTATGHALIDLSGYVFTSSLFPDTTSHYVALQVI